jgi:hypothetical protein
MSIPAGAVNGDVTVTVTPESSPPAGAVGVVYDIGPTGTVFNFPVTMVFHYGSADIGGAPPANLRAATYGSSAWQILAGGKVDTTAKTVSGTTMHLSPYSEILVTTGEVCAQVTSGGSACVNSGGTGTSSPPAGSSTGGSTGSGFAPEDCGTVPTCATATNVCTAYPGATMTGCTDGADGFTASCCFAPSAPVCFTGGESVGCLSAGGGSSSGSQAVPNDTCPDTPTCATAAAAGGCAQYPGAKITNCVNTSDGYTASCCFDPGTPVCVTDDAAIACSGTVAPSGSSGGGSSSSSGGTTSCGPGPTCSDGSACSAYAGATTQSCTNTSSGYNATCCMPLGVLPSASSGSSTGGSTGTSLPPSSGSSGGTSSGGSSGGVTVDAGAPIGTGGSDAGEPPPADASVADGS